MVPSGSRLPPCLVPSLRRWGRGEAFKPRTSERRATAPRSSRRGARFRKGGTAKTGQSPTEQEEEEEECRLRAAQRPEEEGRLSASQLQGAGLQRLLAPGRLAPCLVPSLRRWGRGEALEAPRGCQSRRDSKAPPPKEETSFALAPLLLTPLWFSVYANRDEFVRILCKV